MRRYIRKIFSPYLTVFEAHDGYEALKIAKAHKLSMVLWLVSILFGLLSC